MSVERGRVAGERRVHDGPAGLYSANGGEARVLLPMLFLSGAMFPLRGLPSWLAAITRINPLTYAVDPLRHVVFAAQQMPPAARQRFPTGIELFGHALPLGIEISMVAAFAIVFLSLTPSTHSAGPNERAAQYTGSDRAVQSSDVCHRGTCPLPH